MAQVGFDLGRLGASVITAFALDGEATSGTYRDEVHGGLRKRKILMEARPYKLNGKHEAADIKGACKALWEALHHADHPRVYFWGLARQFKCVEVLKVDANLMAIAETLKKALLVGGWFPEGSEVHVVMLCTWKKVLQTSKLL
uniref:Uncharacterized protein n=1 Tax=Chromera velia CCMP2878 TaxID=1169474 RepID=A0A0G4HYV3_9ALVE|eukprot:Cvel_9571.t1-p1 / transcript=Cvel_9571.t1 / gene=Cvel_9571 / organism=Chromera_velia_CCMP2878 / gene_product=hypothetical protein / transcript_product=hypothetical protein / location=Cvel_scaffold555:3374-3799(+) / protein_length=142 / sequence_SO=supercontig / SO=protein_coding / is_pseudo=false